MKLNTLYFFLFLTPFYLISQNSIDFLQLKGENFSTQSITYAIKKDTEGNLWIASEEGILKNNSKSYKLYNTYNGLPESLSNRASQIFIDSKGTVFAGLEKGVCVYNKFLDKFELLSTKDNINPSLVKSLVEDKHGNIWIGGFNGLWKYDDVSNSLIPTSFNKPITSLTIIKDIILCGTEKGLFVYSITQKSITEIVLDKKLKDIHFIGKIEDKIHVGTESGFHYSLKEKSNSFVFNKIERLYGFPVNDIIKGLSNNILLATDGDGIYELNKQNEILKNYKQDFNNPSSLSSNGIYDIELDTSGILWIATYGGGINYHNYNKLPFSKIQHELNNNNSLASNFTRSIAKDNKGNLWFGSKNGLSIWNLKQNTWRHIKQFNKKNKSQIIVLALESDNDYMWVGTYGYGLYKINVNTFKISKFNDLFKSKNLITKIYAIKKDSNGKIWVGGIDNEMVVISPNNSIKTFPLKDIKAITELRDGNILASGRYGIHKINPKNESFRILEELEPSKSSLAFSTIHSVKELPSNNFVIGTNGAGLIFYNLTTKKIRKINVKSGLPSDIVQGILLKNDNNIWASTTRGLANIITSKTDTVINVYDKRDGLASTEFNYGSYAKLKEFFAFGGVNGVTLFNPDEIIKQEEKPSLVLEKFKLFNKTIKPSEKPLQKHINTIQNLTLKYNENSIGLEFIGIQHSSPNEMKYSWILEGFDKTWSKPSTNNIATYTNLESGEYIFKVKALNKYGNISKERIISIDILSPWWLTNTAFLIYFILSILLIIGVIHFTTVIINKKNADDQIEFFNNITHEIKTPLTILMSSLENITNKKGSSESNKQIKATVKRLNSLFEQMLNFHKVTSQDTIYQNVSKIDLNKYLQGRVKNFQPLTEERNIQIIIENHWKSQIFYYYKDVFDKIILNLLSNAIKYSFDDGTIKIKLNETSKGALKFQIEDQGFGIPKDQQKYILKRYYRARNAINSQKPGTGLGLIMTKKLIEKTGGTISFNSIENKGTTFTVELKNLKPLYKESSISKNNLENLQSAEGLSELDEFSSAKILIVEDNDELRSILVETLGKYFLIFEASNGVEGIEIASQNFPDIILTDLIMPEMDGMEMAKKLKEDISLNHIPVFMLTVLQNSSQKLESIESGISEYLEKPVDTKLLFAKIINTLKFQRKLREKYIHDNDSENANLFRNQKDKDFLKSLEEKIIDNVENNSFSVHDLSASFGMSRTSLYMKLKNLVDLSPQDFIIHTKLKHAKNLLIKGGLSIKEVAYSSGFSNPKYFSTSFKKFYKQTPSRFLDSLKNEQ